MFFGKPLYVSYVVPISTQAYKWVPANLLLGVARWLGDLYFIIIIKGTLCPLLESGRSGCSKISFICELLLISDRP